jgi:hypothetical protein
VASGRSSIEILRGGKGIRTPDLLIANETLYQLSYTPEMLTEEYRDAAAIIKWELVGNVAIEA